MYVVDQELAKESFTNAESLDILEARGLIEKGIGFVSLAVQSWSFCTGTCSSARIGSIFSSVSGDAFSPARGKAQPGHCEGSFSISRSGIHRQVLYPKEHNTRQPSCNPLAERRVDYVIQSSKQDPETSGDDIPSSSSEGDIAFGLEDVCFAFLILSLPFCMPTSTLGLSTFCWPSKICPTHSRSISHWCERDSRGAC